MMMINDAAVDVLALRRAGWVLRPTPEHAGTLELVKLIEGRTWAVVHSLRHGIDRTSPTFGIRDEHGRDVPMPAGPLIGRSDSFRGAAAAATIAAHSVATQLARGAGPQPETPTSIADT